MKKTITIIGSGYVGLTTAAALSNTGYKVFALDVDEKKISIIKSGKSHFYEVGLDNLVKKGIDSRMLIPTTSYEEAIPSSDIIFSCVGTPDNLDGSHNMNFIYSAAEGYAKFAKNGSIYVQKSTVPVGTGKLLVEFIAGKNPKLKFTYVSNPEFLREGSALFDTLNMDRIVVGGEDMDSLDEIVSIHRDIAKLGSSLNQDEISIFANVYKTCLNQYSIDKFEERVVRTSLASAELIKVTANAFLSLKISFANSIAMLCDKVDADVNEVMNGVGADARIGRSFLYAGLGYGGGCFPKDVSGLVSVSEDHGVDNKIMKSAVDINEGMVDFVLQKILAASPRKVGVLGLSFKPGTSDVRKSPAIRLVNKLINSKIDVSAYDPQAMEEAVHDLKNPEICVNEPNDVFRDSNVVVIATDWPEFMDYDWKALRTLMKGNLLVDGRNLLNKEQMKNMGFKYVGVGRR